MLRATDTQRATAMNPVAANALGEMLEKLAAGLDAIQSANHESVQQFPATVSVSVSELDPWNLSLIHI